LRLRKAGYRVLYVAAALAQHQGGHSAKQLSWSSRRMFWYGSLLRYASKHFSTSSRCFVSVAVMLACVPRAVIECFARSSFEPALVYKRVMQLAFVCFWWGETGGKGAAQPDGERRAEHTRLL